jgi:large conductance mechanosensitive channel
MSLMKEFMDFLKKQNIISVALGLVAGLAAKTLIDALVADLITPIYGPYITFLDPTMAIKIFQSNFMIGHFIQSVISFAIVLFVVFIIGKKMIKTE